MHLLLEDVVNEGGLSSTEETCHHGDGRLLLIRHTGRRVIALAVTSTFLVVVLLVL